MKPGHHAQVILITGDTLFMRSPGIYGDSLVGMAAGRRVAMPTATISRIEVFSLDRRRTEMTVAAGAAVGIAAVLYWIWLHIPTT